MNQLKNIWWHYARDLAEAKAKLQTNLNRTSRVVTANRIMEASVILEFIKNLIAAPIIDNELLDDYNEYLMKHFLYNDGVLSVTLAGASLESVINFFTEAGYECKDNSKGFRVLFEIKSSVLLPTHVIVLSGNLYKSPKLKLSYEKS